MATSILPLEFVPVHGSGFTAAKFAGSTLVLPMMGAGMSANIAADLFIMNEGAQKVGFIKSEYISPLVLLDQHMADPSTKGQLSIPCELFQSKDGKLTFLLVQSGICKNMEYAFRTSFAKFIKEHKFESVVLISSSISPVKRERESNREIPEIFGYAN